MQQHTSSIRLYKDIVRIEYYISHLGRVRMRTLTKSLSVFTTFLIILISSSNATEYRTGLKEGVDRPSWMTPSPRIQLNNPLLTLDESCDNSPGLPPVGNQSIQGSCVAWATGYYYLTYLQCQENGLDPNDPENQMSPSFIYNLINWGVDNGAFSSDGFFLFQEMGCGFMSDMPYDITNYTAFPSEEAFRNGHVNRTLNSVFINTSELEGLNNLKTHLQNGNIATTGIRVWDNFQNISEYDYIYSVADICGEDPGSHAVTVIGFDDNIITPDGPGAFRMVNSWGATWGDGGFWWMSYEAFLNGEIGQGTAYYSIDRINYQPTLLTRVVINHSDRHSLKYRMILGNIWEEFFGFAFSYANIEFAPNVFTIDITDYMDEINEEEVNNFNFSVFDNDPFDTQTGQLLSVTVEDLTRNHIACSDLFPVSINDEDNWQANTTIPLYYPAIPPDSFESVIDLATGVVTLNWSEIPNSAGFLGYEVFRNGQSFLYTNELTCQDTLSEYGEYTYSVRSNWSQCNSASIHSNNVNWVVPLAARNLQVVDIHEDGECYLAWDQTRDETIRYDDGVSDDLFHFNSDVPIDSKAAQKFQVSDNGKLNRVGVYISEGQNLENGLIRLGVFTNGDDGTPSDLIWESDSFVPNDFNCWHWVDLGYERIGLNNGDEFWVAVIWEEMGDTPVGRDLNDDGNEIVMLQIGDQGWFTLSGGYFMIRAEYGKDELINNGSGLLGFNVYKDENLIEEILADNHNVTTTLESIGDYTFRVDAVYQQEVMTGDDLEYCWDGNAADVADNNLPLSWSVATPYPNPFNPSTILTVEMADAAKLNVDIFNILGQKVVTLASGKYENGVHRFHFNANGLTSGIYFIRTKVPGRINSIQKVTFIQ